MSEARVIAVARSGAHGIGKETAEVVRLIAGLGVEGDAHAGARDPDNAPPNLRQVHLMAGELIDTLAAEGFPVGPGVMGENLTTRGIDLIALPLDTRLAFANGAVVELKGRRGPCSQLNEIAPGLMNRVLTRDAQGAIAPLCGVLGIVAEGGEVRAGDDAQVILPDAPRQPLPVL